MKLVASLIVKDELSRYLRACVAHLRTYVSEIRVLDDDSRDGTYEWLLRDEHQHHPVPVRVLTASSPLMGHEGKARQELLEWTLDRSDATHVLAIDADEFVAEPYVLLAAIRDSTRPVITAEMQEVWEVDGDCLCLRQDGGWAAHEVGIVWRVVDGVPLMIRNQPLACGRIPSHLERQASQASGTAVLHLGWLDEGARAARHERYMVHDRGRYHSRTHLDSILHRSPKLWGRPYPADLRELIGG